MTSNEEIFGSVSLGVSTKLVFSLWTSNGQKFATARKFASSSRYTGPTKSGFAISAVHLQQLVTLLRRLLQSAPSEGQTSLGTIKRNDSSEWRVQLVAPDVPSALPLVDIREFISSERYTGFTRKGIRVPWEKLSEVLKIFEAQLEALHSSAKAQTPLFEAKHSPTSSVREDREDYQSGSGGLNELPDFPDAFLPSSCILEAPLLLPAEPLQLVADRNGTWTLKGMSGFEHKVRNQIEGKFLLFAASRGKTSVALPNAMIGIFKAVAAYESFCREKFQTTVRELEMKCRNRTLAEFQARQLFQEMRLPLP